MTDRTILNLRLRYVESDELLQVFQNAIENDGKICITYATFNTLNLVKSNNSLVDIFNHFEIVHPDGVGIHYALKFLFGTKRSTKPFTGSDFYEDLIKRAIKKNWSFFFFGNTNLVLKKISQNITSLNIVGLYSGFDYDTNKVVFEIQKNNPDILIVGLGQPLQEQWIFENLSQLNSNIVLAVGDGIKVFARNKIRGYRWVRNIGLEWFIRLVNNPQLYWKRYLIGIPLFILRVIKESFRTDGK